MRDERTIKLLEVSMERSQITPRNFIFRELCCSIILGSIPCFLMIRNSGIDGLISFLKSMTPPDYLVYFFAGLAITHFIIWRFNKFFYSPIDAVSTFKHRLHQISDQVGFSLLGIYRVIAGAIFVALPPIMLVEPTLQNGIYLLVCFTLGVSCVALSCWLSYWQHKTGAGK